MAREIEIVKQVNKIDENKLEVDLNFRIKRIKAWFISNIFGRALSYIVGWTGTQAKMLRCTSGGILKVSSAGSIYETNEVKTATSVNAYASVGAFTGICSEIAITVKTFGVTVKRSPDGVVFHDEFEIDAGESISMDCSTKDIEIKSTVADSHGTVRIIGLR